MGRKLKRTLCVFFACVLLCGAVCTTANAATHTVYQDGNMSTTYVTYFKDIVAGIGFNENYVAFRSGQYEYTMVVGKLEYDDNNSIFLDDWGKEYVFTSSSGYNAQNTYEVNNINDFSVPCSNAIIYSDVGDFPQLEDRGAKYEKLTALLFSIMLLSVVIRRILYHR